MDPRHAERIKIVQQLYSLLFNPVKRSNLDKKTRQILKKRGTIDKLIEGAAPKYPIEKISRVDLAVLRLAVFELMMEKTQPPKVIINEAVELAKEMGGERSSAFVNAVLGSIFEEKNLNLKNVSN